MNKRGVVKALRVSRRSLLVGFFVLFAFNFAFLLTGYATSVASVGLVILSGEFDINITSPKNITYNFTKIDRAINNYTIDLNVTSEGAVVSLWSYDLFDLEHGGVVVRSNVNFTPNTTLQAVRWENELIVNASDSEFNTAVDDVTFFVFVPNSAPEILNLSDSYNICESEYFNAPFTVRDVDEDLVSVVLSDFDPFYLSANLLLLSFQSQEIQIYSGKLNKDDTGNYLWTLTVNDLYSADCCVDTALVNITVIEINNPPAVEELGVQTVNLIGDDSIFYEVLDVYDIEEGNGSSDNISFSIDFNGATEIFGISNEGIIDYHPQPDELGIYNITVGVTDTAIDNIHPSIEDECNQTGLATTTYVNFSLTVTGDNRPPTIIDYYPLELFLSKDRRDSLYFNISKYDPDWTVPDAYWYVDGILRQSNLEGNVVDEFSYSFGCGPARTSEIKAEITDGLLNDSVIWEINLNEVECEEEESPSGGGGGMASCIENWACDEWRTCEDFEYSLELGVISREDYRDITAECLLQFNVDPESCGVQKRVCYDFNFCDTFFKKPDEFQTCHFTPYPNCRDDIKNCHSGGCESLVDCGGPCDACSTCSDDIKNQGEEQIDCGGPCAEVCPEEVTLQKMVLRGIWVILSVILIIIMIGRKLGHILKIRGQLHTYGKKRRK